MKDLFEFLKDYDEGLYKIVKLEIEPSITTNNCVEKIQGYFHQLFKKIKVEETNISIWTNGKENFNPYLWDLLNNDEFLDFMRCEIGISEQEVRLLEKLNKDSNRKKHGEKISDSFTKTYQVQYQSFSIDEKKDYFKLLYDISVKVYNYHFSESLTSGWDISYFNYLNSKVLVSTFSTTPVKPSKLLCSCCGKEIKETDRFCNYCAQNNEHYKG